MNLVSIVVPCYNEELVIKHTHQKLIETLLKIEKEKKINFEIIYVNDGSSDDTLLLLQNIYQESSDILNKQNRIIIVSLAKNFGHQVALTAGLNYAKGAAVISIDADLQDPPEVMGKMLDYWQEGFDVVYGVRTIREGETWFKLFTAKIFYLILKKITNCDIPLNSGDFRLLSRRAVDVFNSLQERNRFIRGLIPWIGLKQTPIYYERHPRFAGETKYPFSKMIKLALDGFIGFSHFPIKFSFYLGSITAIFSFLYGIYILFYSFFDEFAIRGWKSTMVTILFIGGVQLISIGILGEYVARIYDEVKKRPLFIIDDRNSRL